MNLAVTAPVWLSSLLVLLLLLAAAEDAWRMRISNVTVLAILAGAILAAMAGPTLALWQNLALFAGLLALGTAAFAAGKLGGGDVKLMAVSGAWFDLDGGLLMLICTLLAGGLLALLILLLRMFGWSEKVRQHIAVLRPGSGIPYGVAIAAGGLIAIGLS